MKRNEGFTLIEIMMIVLIIGILVSISVPNYRRAVERSKCAQALATLRNLRNALEAYYLDNDTYIVAPAGTELATLGALVNTTFTDNDDWAYTFATAVITFTITATRQRGEHAVAGQNTITINETDTIGGDYPINDP